MNCIRSSAFLFSTGLFFIKNAAIKRKTRPVTPAKTDAIMIFGACHAAAAGVKSRESIRCLEAIDKYTKMNCLNRSTLEWRQIFSASRLPSSEAKRSRIDLEVK
jgi:hypothetical protein